MGRNTTNGQVSDCRELKEQLIEEINNKSCNEIIEEKNLRQDVLKLYEKKINYFKKVIVKRIEGRYAGSMHSIYKMLYDPEPVNNPLPLTKMFRIKAQLLNYTNGLIIHFALINNVFEIIFEDELVQKYYIIENEDQLKEIIDSDFQQYIADYDVRIGAYTDEILEDLTYKKYNNNTRTISIPFEENFDFEPVTQNTYIEFYPTISVNYNLRFSLMTRLVEKTLTIPSDPTFQDIYYDDFCLKPPGC